MTRVLVIDDSRAFRARLHAALRSEGLEVLEAGDVLAGLQRAVEDAPSLIVLPELLCGFDGLEACERLSQDPVGRAIPILLLADRDTPDLRRRADRAGARAVAPRTLRRRELCALASQLLVIGGAGRPAANARPAAPSRSTRSR